MIRATRNGCVPILAAAVFLGVAGCAAVPDANQPSTGPSSATPAATSRVAATGDAPISKWYQRLGPKIAQVERAVTHAQHTVDNPGHRGLHAACRVMKQRAVSVRQGPAAPDRIVRHAVSREMTHLVKAADHCTSDELLPAGRDVDFAHYWSTVADRRILHLLRHAN